MKLKFIYTFFGLAAFTLITMSNSGGRAGGGQGATTAPGEGTVCTTCHNGGSFGASVDVILKDKASGAEVTEYMPGVTYDVEVSIGTSTTPSGYGFQVLALQNSDNSSISTWANNITANTRLTTNSGRQYFEQADIATTNIFEAEWTAPVAGTGSVTFYAAGNAVDGSGSTAGDQAVTSEITFMESTTSTSGLAKLGISLSTFPNPTVNDLTLMLTTTKSKDLVINIYNLNGQKIDDQNVIAQTGENRFQFDVEAYTSGIYFVEITDGINRTSTRFVKY
ncbi:MAG: choice-of-anchor V domain-containing protein [Saprospiraceae bacterium]